MEVNGVPNDTGVRAEIAMQEHIAHGVHPFQMLPNVRILSLKMPHGLHDLVRGFAGVRDAFCYRPNGFSVGFKCLPTQAAHVQLIVFNSLADIAHPIWYARGDAESYRAGMGQRVGAIPLVQGVGRQHRGFNTREFFDFDLDACKAEQRGSTLDGVDQNPARRSLRGLTHGVRRTNCPSRNAAFKFSEDLRDGLDRLREFLG